ncbi:MAG: glycoside hydrolase family 3 N-terminal domain-containing protein, partial [Pseudomonadota bacterium]
GFHGRTQRDRDVRDMLRDVRAGLTGGVIVMDRNVRRTAALKPLTRAMTAAADAGGHPPLFIAVDQEGGAVQRIRAVGRYRRYPSAWRLARTGATDRAEQVYATLSAQLARLGFNLNFGPVVDLRTNPRNPIIARRNRSYGEDPDVVSAFARIFVDAHHRNGVLTALKHFPGHGSSRRDSHHGFVDITPGWVDAELRPYADLLRTGHADMVMIGHLYHRMLADAGARRPATLSRKAVTELLRGELGFQGVIITDDLAMGAIRRNFSLKDAIEGAVTAGNDILLATSEGHVTRGLAARMVDIVTEGVLAGRIPRTRIDESHGRILALKTRMGSLGRVTRFSRTAVPLTGAHVKGAAEKRTRTADGARPLRGTVR